MEKDIIIRMCSDVFVLTAKKDIQQIWLIGLLLLLRNLAVSSEWTLCWKNVKKQL